MAGKGVLMLEPWLQAKDLINKGSSKSEKLVKSLLFLFPIFVVSVMHWASVMFFLLALSTLIIYVKDARNFYPKHVRDRIFIGILAFYFLAFLLTSFVNGWDMDATYALGVEIKFIAIIPLYLVVRQYRGVLPYLMMGTIFGVLSSFIVFLYERLHLGGYFTTGYYKDFTNGPYGHLFIGPVTSLFVVVVIAWIIRYKQSTLVRNVAIFICVLGAFPIINSFARSAYLACIVSFFLITILSIKGRHKYIFILFIIASSIFVYSTISKVKYRVDSGVNEIKNYFSAKNPVLNPNGFESLDTRLEMWRSARYFFRDHPIFGVGRFHFQREAKKYIKEKLLHPAAGTASHPHNIFVEALIEKGLLGLIGLVAMIFWPLYEFFKDRDNPHSLIGIIIITTIAISGLTESAPIVKDNFAAIFMVYLAVIFAVFNNYKNDQQTQNNAASHGATS